MIDIDHHCGMIRIMLNSEGKDTPVTHEMDCDDWIREIEEIENDASTNGGISFQQKVRHSILCAAVAQHRLESLKAESKSNGKNSKA